VPLLTLPRHQSNLPCCLPKTLDGKSTTSKSVLEKFNRLSALQYSTHTEGSITLFTKLVYRGSNWLARSLSSLHHQNLKVRSLWALSMILSDLTRASYNLLRVLSKTLLCLSLFGQMTKRKTRQTSQQRRNQPKPTVLSVLCFTSMSSSKTGVLNRFHDIRLSKDWSLNN
jgi:hypothetical protein